MKIKTIPVIPKVTIPAPIAKPTISIPPVITLTPDDALYYQKACDDYGMIGQEDGYTLSEINNLYPGLDRSAACNWAIYGFTVQGWLTFESQLNRLGVYTEQLRNRISYLESMIKELEQNAKVQQDAILENNND